MLQLLECFNRFLCPSDSLIHFVKATHILVEVSVSVVEYVRDGLAEIWVQGVGFNYDLAAYVLYLLVTPVEPVALFSNHFQIMRDSSPCLFACL